jgi:NifU-like protein involved in Fe-S cluster formation
MVYSDALLDHFQHPRNAGELTTANVVAEGENPVCGDRLRVELQIQDGRIAAMRWRTEGCAPAIAAASAASELLQGASLEDARRLDRNALSAALGGIPARKSHAATLVLTTIAQALETYPSTP